MIARDVLMLGVQASLGMQNAHVNKTSTLPHRIRLVNPGSNQPQDNLRSARRLRDAAHVAPPLGHPQYTTGPMPWFNVPMLARSRHTAIFSGLLKMAHAADSQCMCATNLTLFDFAILDAAACFEQGVQLKDLEKLGRDRRMIEAAAVGLESRSLVERTRSAQDRRAFALVATDWGTVVAASTAATIDERWAAMTAKGEPGALKAIQRLTIILSQMEDSEGDLLHRFAEALLSFETRFVACFDRHAITAPQACMLLFLLDAKEGMSLLDAKDELFCDRFVFARAVLSLQNRNLVAIRDDTGQARANSTAKLTSSGEGLANELKTGIARILNLESEEQGEAASSLALLLGAVEPRV